MKTIYATLLSAAIATALSLGAVARADTTTYGISGVAYLDMSGNGAKDADEPVLSNVSVNLSDGQSVKTDVNGNDSFSNLLAGNYSISIPEATATVLDDFNESLS